MSSPALNEDYYAGSGIPESIPIRVRKICVEQLGDRWIGVRPDDNVGDARPDLELAELLYGAEDEFGIKMSDEEMRKMDGTIDAIGRYVALIRHRSHNVESNFQLSDTKAESV